MPRKGAGTETRPLASILFVNVETKRSIPRFEPCPLLDQRQPAFQPIGAASVAIAGMRRSMGVHGITWDTMGVNGWTWSDCGKTMAHDGRGLAATAFASLLNGCGLRSVASARSA